MTTQTITPEASLAQILGDSCTREEALSLLQEYPECYSAFCSFKPRYQEQLLSFLQGKSGLSITYNSFFQHILNPEVHPRRLESLLSALIGESVTIRQVLPNEGGRLAEHGSLVIMDVIAELTDGSIVDIEMQKIGYHFPSQRSSCYVSDMIMRQYNRVKSDRKKNFSYQELKPVYLIILMEKSPKEFHTYPYEYVHRRITSYTSGIQLPELTQITYISLDTFHSIVQNVDTELDAWLTFLSSTEASGIIHLVLSMTAPGSVSGRIHSYSRYDGSMSVFFIFKFTCPVIIFMINGDNNICEPCQIFLHRIIKYPVFLRRSRKKMKTMRSIYDIRFSFANMSCQSSQQTSDRIMTMDDIYFFSVNDSFQLFVGPYVLFDAGRTLFYADVMQDNSHIHKRLILHFIDWHAKVGRIVYLIALFLQDPHIVQFKLR